MTLTLSLLCVWTSAEAVENGVVSTTFGVNDFGAGLTPPPTANGTLSIRTGFYSSRIVKDNQGNRVDNDVDLDLLSIVPFYIRMTENTLLGANYGFGIIVPFFKMDAELKVQTPAGPMKLEADPFRMSDAVFVPLILQWNVSPNLFVNSYFSVTAPTGDYDKKRLVSPGINHWTYSPGLSATYITDSGFEVSSNFQVDVSSRNKATDYKNGVEYRHEFAVGQHIGPWTVGLGGFYYRQISDDDAPHLTTGNRAAVSALGPAVAFFKPGLPPISAHLYKEFDARNRAEGYTFAVRVSQSF
ncbi:SphA family protein [Pseudomonas citri]|uniref:SphA family protein n=1 Tax=Pseudomonas citri TaxID=2978349 RepID=UPI0021B5E7F0|nr:transporter [Pseudomonas citri]